MTSVNISDDLYSDAKKYASVESRSITGQIEHWAKIGKIMQDNPDLPYDFVRDILLAQTEDPIDFDLSELDE